VVDEVGRKVYAGANGAVFVFADTSEYFGSIRGIETFLTSIGSG